MKTPLNEYEVSVISHEVIDRLQHYFGYDLRDVILYGDYAEGNADGCSGLMYLCLVNYIGKYDTIILEYNLHSFEEDLSLKFNRNISILNLSDTYFKRHVECNPFFASIAEKGQRLFPLVIE